MSKSALKTNTVNNVVYFDKNDQKHKLTFDQVQRSTKHITRADDRTKTIKNKQAAFLITTINSRLNASKDGVIYLDHDYLSDITGCLPDQNTKILKQLADIIDFKYHRFVKEVKKSYCYEIKYTQDGESRIRNPELFYDLEAPKKDKKTRKNAPIETKSYPKKIGVIAEKNRPSDLRYIEDIEYIKEIDPLLSSSLPHARAQTTKYKIISNIFNKTTQPEEIAIGAISHSAKTETVSSEVKLMKPDKISSIGKLNTEIFKAFDNKTSEEIIENCIFEELAPDKLGISIHKGFEISIQDKEKLKSCIRMTFGNEVKMVNVSVPQQKLTPKLSLVEVEQKQEIPLDTPRFGNQEWVEMKEKIAKYFPENQYQYVLFTWLSNLNLVTVEKNKIIVSSSDFYIDEIFQRFSTAIDIAVILMKKNLVLQYESNQQRPIEFSCKPSSRRK